jgi:hypothetical protein
MKNHFLPVWSAVGALAISIPVILTVQPHSLAQNPQPPGSTATYPVINGGVDWRSVNAQNIPWSKPVIVNDPFDGKYLAVFDRNYKDLDIGGRASIISEWTRQFIRVSGYLAVERCGPFLACGANAADAPANFLEIKVGNQIFRIPGNGSGTFPVSNQLAAALASAPPGDALIRVTLNGVNQSVTSAIGAGTVNAWKVVYGGSQ